MRESRCFWLLSSRSSPYTVVEARASKPPKPSRCYHSTPKRQQNGGSRRVQSLYVDTVPPTSNQAQAAEAFFRTHLPSKSWTATEWRKQPHSDNAYLTPEVAFLGRSNSGKSSLLNGILLNPSLCRVGPKPGKTATMHAWALSPVNPTTRGARKGYKGDTEAKLTVLDMPGYGHGSQREWGMDIMKYLTARRQLRRAFVLVNPAHGLKKQDLQMLELLRSHGISHQLIATKCDHDSVKNLPLLLAGIQASVRAHFSSGKAGPVLITINDILAVGGLGDGKMNNKTKLEEMQGLEDVRWAVVKAAGLEQYATTLLVNAGLPPKQKQKQSLAQFSPEVSAVHISAKTDLAMQPSKHELNMPAQMEDVPASLDPPRRAPPQIGIGIDELMAMTSPSSRSWASRGSANQT